MTWFARTPSRIESEALLDYWDDVIDRSPTTPVPPVQVPAEIGALVRTINNADTTNPDYPAYEDRLLQALLARQKESIDMHALATTAPVLSSPPTSSRVAVPRLPSVPLRKYAMPVFEIALIIVLLFASATGIWLAGDRNDPHRIVAPAVATPTAEASPSVPMYRGNPERNGVMPGPGPEGQPVELWRTEVEGSINSAPAVVDGVLYFGAGDGGVYALDTATGAEVWTFQGSSPVSSSPAVLNGVVYVGSEDGTLYALDAATGTEVWAFPGARADAAVAIVNGALYTGSGDGFLYALDAATGEEYWRAPLNEAASRSPAVAGGVVYMGSADGVLHTFDSITGEPGWALRLEGGVVATTTIVDGVVYQNTFDGDVNHAYALDAATGEELWRFDTASGQGFLPPAVGNGLVYLPSTDNTVYAVDAATGEPVWTFETGDQVSAAPALVGDTLYVGGRDQNVYALDAATGNELWRFTVEGEIDFGPTVIGGVAYVGTIFGYMYAIGGSGDALPATPGIGAAIADATPASTPAPATPAATPVATPEATADGVASTELATFLWETTGGPEELSKPASVTIAPDGMIWVADGGNSRFQIFDPDGTFIELWGVPGEGEGEFNFIRPNSSGDAFGSVAFAPDGSFYVADMGNQRIQHFAADRQFLHAWGGFGPADGEFLSPWNVVVDSEGNVFVNDDRREDVQKFGPDGAFLLKFGGSGSDPGQLVDQWSMSIDSNDQIWVADPENGRIQQWDNNGQFIAAFDGNGMIGYPVAAAVDTEGRILVTDLDGLRVVVLDPSGAVIGQWGSEGASEGQLSDPLVIALDGQGNAYVIDYLTNRLIKFHLLPPLAP